MNGVEIVEEMRTEYRDALLEYGVDNPEIVTLVVAAAIGSALGVVKSIRGIDESVRGALTEEIHTQFEDAYSELRRSVS